MDAISTVNLLRRMRHDFGNHLQIISGYTDLGRPEEVKEYIAHLTKDLEQERLLFELDSAEASLFLYEQMLLVKDLGVIVKYKELDISSGQKLRANNQPFNIIKSLLNEHNLEDETIIEVSVYESPLQTEILIYCPRLAEDILTFYLKE